jgi:hypothetical protein
VEVPFSVNIETGNVKKSMPQCEIHLRDIEESTYSRNTNQRFRTAAVVLRMISCFMLLEGKRTLEPFLLFLDHLMEDNHPTEISWFLLSVPI